MLIRVGSRSLYSNSLVLTNPLVSEDKLDKAVKFNSFSPGASLADLFSRAQFLIKSEGKVKGISVELALVSKREDLATIRGEL